MSIRHVSRNEWHCLIVPHSNSPTSVSHTNINIPIGSWRRLGQKPHSKELITPGTRSRLLRFLEIDNIAVSGQDQFREYHRDAVAKRQTTRRKQNIHFLQFPIPNKFMCSGKIYINSSVPNTPVCFVSYQIHLCSRCLESVTYKQATLNASRMDSRISAGKCQY